MGLTPEERESYKKLKKKADVHHFDIPWYIVVAAFVALGIILMG